MSWQQSDNSGRVLVMKKIIGLILINFFIFSGSSKAGSIWGEGDLQLTDSVAQYFIQFIIKIVPAAI